MSTNYDGDPTNAQAPDVAPEPDSIPKIVLPLDGEPYNVSSLHQAFKSLADHVAWLSQPKAKATDYAKYIATWRAAGGQKRFAIDHFGFPAGRLGHVRENLLAKFAAPNVSTGGYLTWGEITVSATQVMGPGCDPNWQYRTVRTSGTQNLGTGGPVIYDGRTGRTLVARAGGTTGDYVATQLTATAMFAPTVIVAAEFDGHIYLDSGGGVDHTSVVGLTNGVYTAALPSVDTKAGAWFKGIPGGDWLCVTSDGSSALEINSGIPANATERRFRLVVVGASADDGGAQRALFFIDGALVANVSDSGTLPGAGDAAAFFVGNQCDVGGGGVSSLVVGGPINVVHNTWLDAV